MEEEAVGDAVDVGGEEKMLCIRSRRGDFEAERGRMGSSRRTER